MLISKWLLKVKMTQFTKLYLKLDKEKEHLISFNYSEKYSICSQGRCWLLEPSKAGMGWPLSGLVNEGIVSTSLFLYLSFLPAIGWLASRLRLSIPSKLLIQTFSFLIQIRKIKIIPCYVY